MRSWYTVSSSWNNMVKWNPKLTWMTGYKCPYFFTQSRLEQWSKQTAHMSVGKRRWNRPCMPLVELYGLNHWRVLSVLMALCKMVLMKVEHSQEQGYIFPLKCSGERELNNQSLPLSLSSYSIKSVEISEISRFCTNKQWHANFLIFALHPI